MTENKTYVLEPSNNPHKISLFYEPTQNENTVKITLDLSQSRITLNQKEQKNLKAESPTKTVFTIPRSTLIQTLNGLLQLVYTKTG